MINFGINPQKEKALFEKMNRLKIHEHDLEEQFIRSQGKGGQNVNKTSTCVFLKHKPSGIIVKCQKERVQILNRYLARKILADKIESMILGKESEEKRKAEKIKRQKRKRSKRAKEKMLKMKHGQSVKKSNRAFIKHYNPDSDQ